MLLPIGDCPAVIRESARCVLAAHGFIITDKSGNPIGPRETESLLSELGRNASQALYSLDELDIDGEPMPEAEPIGHDDTCIGCGLPIAKGELSRLYEEGHAHAKGCPEAQ